MKKTAIYIHEIAQCKHGTVSNEKRHGTEKDKKVKHCID